MVDVAADRGYRSDLFQFPKYHRISHIAGMNDVLRSLQRLYSFGPKQSMRIGDDANVHISGHHEPRGPQSRALPAAERRKNGAHGVSRGLRKNATKRPEGANDCATTLTTATEPKDVLKLLMFGGTHEC